MCIWKRFLQIRDALRTVVLPTCRVLRPECMARSRFCVISLDFLFLYEDTTHYYSYCTATVHTGSAHIVQNAALRYGSFECHEMQTESSMDAASPIPWRSEGMQVLAQLVVGRIGGWSIKFSAALPSWAEAGSQRHNEDGVLLNPHYGRSAVGAERPISQSLAFPMLEGFQDFMVRGAVL